MRDEHDFNPTGYPDVNSILHVLLLNVQIILWKKLVGFYLYGSLSLGDFDPRSSDIDFLIVTSEELDAKTLEQLRVMHAAIAASDLLFARRLEGSYIPVQALRRYDPQDANHPTIGSNWDFGIGWHGSNWVIERYIVREHGTVVWGPSPQTLIDPISPRELCRVACDSVLSFWQAQLDKPEWLRSLHYQAFAIFIMCRALYTIETGQVATKPQAATWAYRHLDPKLRELIEQARDWQYRHEEADLTQTVDFIRYTVETARQKCSQAQLLETDNTNIDGIGYVSGRVSTCTHAFS